MEEIFLVSEIQIVLPRTVTFLLLVVNASNFGSRI